MPYEKQQYIKKKKKRKFTTVRNSLSPLHRVSVCTGSERQCAYRQRASVCVPAAGVSVCTGSGRQCVYRQRASVCVPAASVSVRTGSERQCAYRQRASVCVPAASVSVRTGSERQCAYRQRARAQCTCLQTDNRQNVGHIRWNISGPDRHGAQGPRIQTNHLYQTATCCSRPMQTERAGMPVWIDDGCQV